MKDKLPLLKIFLLTIVLLLLSFVCVYLFTEPVFWDRLNLTSTSSIGDTIGGITAPLLGIISVIFLYLTLNRQIDSINDQKLKNESDIIFMLLNQLEVEYNQIYMNNTSKDITTKLYGHEALTKYANSIFKYYNTAEERKFSTYYIADSILLVIRSFKLIEERIKMSNLNDELKSMFTLKLETFYQCKLQDSLYKLCNLFERVELLNDSYTEEIKEFEKRFNSGK
ncbi:hypothetical protein [Mangrovimonas sp. YM274]|uniref:hypothetical protein n=1 Tax=Mangrovimonas sp. YM274 TaxID=3070660 RepID=UPI0027DB5181|nr:hypothetical protein [Mangrovimonas sp. YM274]WMI69163.1 hypothetical protein RBH95_02040 [Mangrovimonas sp. YM274]